MSSRQKTISELPRNLKDYLKMSPVECAAEVALCSLSRHYFLENYGTVTVAGVGTIPFSVLPHITEVVDRRHWRTQVNYNIKIPPDLDDNLNGG